MAHVGGSRGQSQEDKAEARWRAESTGGLTTLAVLVIALGHLLGGNQWLLLDAVAAGFLVPLVLIDLRERRLPDRLTLAGAAILLALIGARAAISGDVAPVAGALAGAALMAGILLALHLASPRGMGFGDVKLGLLLGVLVGARSVALVLPVLLLAGLLGALVGVVQLVRRRRRDVTLPFGPFLVAGAVLALVLVGH
jgi:leader peptidase (prepilin peptidase) / N-methyltransferase